MDTTAAPDEPEQGEERGKASVLAAKCARLRTALSERWQGVPLNEQQERFCAAWLRLGNGAAAVLEAYPYKAHLSSAKRSSLASKMLRSPRIAARVAELRAGNGPVPPAPVERAAALLPACEQPRRPAAPRSAALVLADVAAISAEALAELSTEKLLEAEVVLAVCRDLVGTVLREPSRLGR